MREKNEEEAFRRQRESMVSRQIKSRGIRDEKILNAMMAVPRHKFMPSGARTYAYEDRPVPIGHNQTISQPYIVARMIDQLELKGGEKVLEVGTGMGYQTAVLAEIADSVYSIERIPELKKRAERIYEDLGIENAYLKTGDGSKGWPEAAPFDRIIVAAAASNVPEALKEQLAVGGLMIIPVGSHVYGQQLYRIQRENETAYHTDKLDYVAFVPLVQDEV
jgi:protein-L-isoaspartate(D-aspartate) O-methyltransferase